MSKLILQISNDPINGNPREAEMFQLRFTADWEIEIEMDIHEKQNGQRLFNVAQTIEGLTTQQREDAKSKYFPKRSKPYQTKGTKVNGQGQVDANGSINEIDFLFSLSFAQLKAIMGKTDSDSVLQTIKEFVGAKMVDISNRGQL